MRYNAGNGGVQLSVNLISRLEEERPTRLYACRERIRTPDQALGNSRFSRLGHPGGLHFKAIINAKMEPEGLEREGIFIAN